MNDDKARALLLPCPFCGGEAQRYDIDCDDPLDANDGGSGIECKQCHATSALHFERKENLVSSWNDRFSSHPPASFRRIYDKMQRGKVSADDSAKGEK